MSVPIQDQDEMYLKFEEEWENEVQNGRKQINKVSHNLVQTSYEPD